MTGSEVLICKHDLYAPTCAICTLEAKKVEEENVELLSVIDSEMTTCKHPKCNDSIVWARTVNDRLMPVDVEPVAGGNVELRLDNTRALLATVLSRSAAAQRAEHETLWTSHFATCEYAGDFRR